MRYTFKNSGVLNLGETVKDIGREEYSKRYRNAVPMALSKLGQLEDIEEEHGCDLVKVMKALTDGCWIRNGEFGICCLDAEPRFIKPSNLLIGMVCYEEMRNKNDWNAIKKDECLCIFDMFYEDINRIARLSDYGKTWALTKEELELE